MPVIHASCVAIDGVGVLISGSPQTGKSSLCFELLSRGAALVSDDQTRLKAVDDKKLLASAPKEIAGLIEMAGVGVLEVPDLHKKPIPIAFEIRLSETKSERLPEPQKTTYDGVSIPCFQLLVHDISVAAKILFLAQVFQQTGHIETVTVAKLDG